MKVSQAIIERYSPKEFGKGSISKDQMHELFIAMQQAPSCFNEQPWKVFYASKTEHPEFFQTLLSLLVPGNAEWAKDASVLMITAVSTTFEKNGKINAFARHDLGLGMGQLILLAKQMHIGLHQMGGFDAPKAFDILGLPEDWEAVAAVAMGVLKEEIPSLDKKRKSIDEFVFSEAYVK